MHQTTEPRKMRGKNLTEGKKRNRQSVIIVGDFATPLSATGRPVRQSIGKDTEEIDTVTNVVTPASHWPTESTTRQHGTARLPTRQSVFCPGPLHK